MTTTLPPTVDLLLFAASLIRKLRRVNRGNLRRAVSRRVHLKQFDKIEGLMVKALNDYFEEQIVAVAANLADLESKEVELIVKSSDAATNLAQQVFDPREWWESLIDRMLPVVSKGMAEASSAQFAAFGVDLRKTAKSTATDWLDMEGILDEMEAGGILSEYPQWMKDSIEIQLRETFAQDYWGEINLTTRKNIEQFLQEGLQEGWSIQRMSRTISDTFPSQYSMARARLVARTESAHALNAGRKLAYDRLQEDLGPQIPMRSQWLSVLGNTTRDSHASLDGVPSDEKGMWRLVGIDIPWPGHINLPPSERCNCQCSITTEFGMQDAEAEQLIQDYYGREESNLGKRLTLTIKYRIGQPRDSFGRWSSGGATLSPDTGGSFGGGGIAADNFASAVKGSDNKWKLSNDKEMPSHIPYIPPAWVGVRVNLNPKAGLLIQGKDIKGRNQSVYSKEHTSKASAAKFSRTSELRKKLPEIEASIKKDMGSSDPNTRESATILALLNNTGMRPGGSGDTKADKKAYGATTLEARHITVGSTGAVSLNYVGKKGVKRNVKVTDENVAAELKRKKMETPSNKPIFAKGAVGRLRKYTHSKDGGSFKPKDFRTAKGTSTAFKSMKKIKTPKNAKEYKAAVREVGKRVAAVLGNTPAIAIQSYVDPTLFSKWRSVSGTEKSFAPVRSSDQGDLRVNKDVANVYYNYAEVSFGEVGAPLPDWRKTSIVNEDDPDDELLNVTPPDVIEILGFDPLEWEDEKSIDLIGKYKPDQPRVPTGGTGGQWTVS